MSGMSGSSVGTGGSTDSTRSGGPGGVAHAGGLALQLALSRPGFALDVALNLPARGITALLGPSGCGKTTVLRAIAGLARARGRIALGDQVWQDDTQRLWRAPHQRPLGYVIQEAALFPHLSVAANLAYGQKRAGAAARRVDLDALVALLGIGHLMDRRPTGLSGGERQRVAIARALATGPELLLMDEPLAALDAARKAELLPYLETLHQQLALPVVYVTHALDEALRLADHLVLMADGRVQAEGPLHQLLARPDLPLHQADDAGVVVEAVVAEHVPSQRLSRLQFAGGTLWVGLSPAAVGQTVRARVLARDVSVTRQRPEQTSILNVLPVVLQRLHAQPGSALLQLQASGDDAAPGEPIEPAEAPAPSEPTAAAGTHPSASAPPGRATHRPSATPPLLLARITRRSLEQLALAPGDRLYAQIKGVALM